MAHIYVKRRESYEDFSSGKVLYNAPGLTAFPVRLASEIAQRCFNLLKCQGRIGPYVIYDPCCGGAYLLTTVGFLHAKNIKKIIASDCDEEALIIAEKNLSLLTPSGINKRIEELKILVRAHGKAAHIQAVQSALKLRNLVEAPIEIVCFKEDITTESQHKLKADIIVADFPYGQLTNWKSEITSPINAFFNNILKYLKSETSLIVTITDKGEKLRPIGFTKKDHFKVGKRQVNLFSKTINI